jgi:protein Tex
VKVGQIVKVQVISADAKAKRIALSMKALEAAPPEPKRKNFKPAPPPKPSFNDAVSALADKFKRR